MGKAQCGECCSKLCSLGRALRLAGPGWLSPQLISCKVFTFFLSMGLVLISFFFFCFERRCTSACLGTCKGRVSCGGEAKAEEVEKITAWEKKKRAFAYIWEGC